MPSTIKDVAKLAKVSPSTVSRVISNSSKISDATKSRVYAAMKELKYKPNIIARSLANKSTKTLGLILPDTDAHNALNPFFIQLMRGISFYAQRRGYYILYSYASEKNDRLKVVKDMVDSKWVDGIILANSEDQDIAIEYLKEIEKPFVVVGRPYDSEGALWVDNDNFHAMYDVVNRLIRKGNKNIAFIGGIKNYTVTRDRYEGYKKALEGRGIELNSNLVVYTDFDEDHGYEAAKEILSNYDVDAFATTDDLLAFGALKAIKTLGLSHKDVVGFNNMLLAQYFKPTLSSVEIRSEELGHHAAKLLIDYLNNNERKLYNYIVDTAFIERESTRPAKP